MPHRKIEDAGQDETEGHIARSGRVEDAGQAEDADGHIAKAGRLEDAGDAEGHIARPGRIEDAGQAELVEDAGSDDAEGHRIKRG